MFEKNSRLSRIIAVDRNATYASLIQLEHVRVGAAHKSIAVYSHCITVYTLDYTIGYTVDSSL